MAKKQKRGKGKIWGFCKSHLSPKKPMHRFRAGEETLQSNGFLFSFRPPLEGLVKVNHILTVNLLLTRHGLASNSTKKNWSTITRGCDIFLHHCGGCQMDCTWILDIFRRALGSESHYYCRYNKWCLPCPEFNRSGPLPVYYYSFLSLRAEYRDWFVTL